MNDVPDRPIDHADTLMSGLGRILLWIRAMTEPALLPTDYPQSVAICGALANVAHNWPSWITDGVGVKAVFTPQDFAEDLEELAAQSFTAPFWLSSIRPGLLGLARALRQSGDRRAPD